MLVRTVDATGPLKEQLGERPLIEYELRLDGTTLKFDSLNSAIQIGLPHSAAVPATNNAFIIVWKVDKNGVILPIVNGDYDAARLQALVTTTSSSGQYAAVYNRKTFQDISISHWAKFAVDVLASKGVLKGISESAFKPEQTVTRADFALWLVSSLGLSATGENSFADVLPSDSFYEGLMTAKKLGIINGQADGLYYPHDSLSRQDMFVMTARALKAAGVWKSSTVTSSDLDYFTDLNQISSYAADDITKLVAAGLIKGDAQQQLKPAAQSTRAEAAMLIYRILIQK